MDTNACRDKVDDLADVVYNLRTLRVCLERLLAFAQQLSQNSTRFLPGRPAEGHELIQGGLLHQIKGWLVAYRGENSVIEVRQEAMLLQSSQVHNTVGNSYPWPRLSGDLVLQMKNTIW